jgi:hypothetical protein
MTEFWECRRGNVSENSTLFMKAAFADNLSGRLNVVLIEGQSVACEY